MLASPASMSVVDLERITANCALENYFKVVAAACAKRAKNRSTITGKLRPEDGCAPVPTAVFSTKGNTMNVISFRRWRNAAATALIAAGCTNPASANLMHVSTSGLGQVLLFPYYTTRNDTVSLLSLVNTSVSAKAVRINVREARGGFVVARLNVYLSAKDVWTAAIIPDGEGAKLVTNDVSCTAPLVGTGLAFDNAAYAPTGNTLPNELRSRDRTREGYIEVIEMAAIPNATKTGVLVTHVNGVPSCGRDAAFNAPAGPKITDASYEPPVADLQAPNGQLMGTLSFVNVSQGMLASTAPTVLDNFWRTDAAAPNPRVWATTATGIDLTTGGNRFVNLPRYNTDATVASESHYVAEFASSIDAVSAVLMVKGLKSEYAFTKDNIVNATSVFNFPTKPNYVFSTALGPFENNWNATTQESCDAVEAEAYDRNSTSQTSLGAPSDFSAGRFREFWRTMCFVGNVWAYGGTAGTFNSPLMSGFFPLQNGGEDVLTVGNEGGWVEPTFPGAQAKLTAVAASAVERKNGLLALTPVGLIVQGLPVIGFTMTQSVYKLGSPQQNFGDISPLRREPSYQETR
jgi:hypothetical protein